MTTVTQVKELDELVRVWPRIMVLLHNTPGDVALQTALLCLVKGAVFVVRGDVGLIGLCCVERQDDDLVVHSLPKGDAGTKTCLSHVEDWARAVGARRLRITNSRWNGSNFRYFEKTLGFERSVVTFIKEL